MTTHGHQSPSHGPDGDGADVARPRNCMKAYDNERRAVFSREFQQWIDTSPPDPLFKRIEGLADALSIPLPSESQARLAQAPYPGGEP